MVRIDSRASIALELVISPDWEGRPLRLISQHSRVRECFPWFLNSSEEVCAPGCVCERLWWFSLLCLG